MEQKAHRNTQMILGAGTVIGWFGLIAQLYLIIINRQASLPETIIRYFSFYTILTNILVALCFTVLLFRPLSYWGSFFSRTATLTAITAYITVVGIIYNLILRFIWNPQGLQRIVDEILHVIIPVLFLVYWFFFVQKTSLKWKNAFPWLVYPFVYLIYILLRGRPSGFYPYPFVEVNKLGYTTVFRNSFFLFIGFLLISLILILVTRITNKTSVS